MIETERLLIRQVVPDDAAFVLELLTSDLWLRFIGDRGVRTLADARRFILDGPMVSYEQHSYGGYVVALRSSGEPVGMCGLYQRPILNHPDIGFAFLPEHIQRGYGYESASAVLRYETERRELPRILGITSPDNHNSIRLLERLGLQFERKIQFQQDGEMSLLYGTPVDLPVMNAVSFGDFRSAQRNSSQ